MTEAAYIPSGSGFNECHDADIGLRLSLHEIVNQVHQSDKYSDLTITCQNRTFPVHKIIVSGHSKVFAAMIDDDLKGAKASRIDLSEEDPIIVEQLIRFFYQGDYDADLKFMRGDEYEPIPLSKLPCTVHAQLYALGFKYDIPTLLNRAASHYHRVACSDDGFDYDDHHDFTQLYIDFLSSIPIVYTVPARENGNDLRNLAVSHMARMAFQIELATSTSEELKNVRDRALEIHGFASELARRLMRSPSVVCDSCVNKAKESINRQPLSGKLRKYYVGQLWCTICHGQHAYCRVNDAKRVLQIDRDWQIRRRYIH